VIDLSEILDVRLPVLPAAFLKAADQSFSDRFRVRSKELSLPVIPLIDFPERSECLLKLDLQIRQRDFTMDLHDIAP
jgi:hypothetical protein